MIINRTDKKFYNKWIYKASIKIHGARSLHWLTSHEDLSWIGNRKVDIDSIVHLHTFLSFYDPSEWQRRIESDNVDIYTNNKKLHENIVYEFKNQIDKISIPGDFDYNEKRKFEIIHRKSLPHKKYKFKVYLKPHVLDKESKYSFLNFLETQEEKIKISNAVKKWFIDNTVNWDPRYIYIEDEGTLLMLKLRNPDVLGRIYEIVIG